MSIYLRNILRFITIMFIQVFLLNDIHLQWLSSSWGLPPYSPFLYPLIILLLPLSTPTWAMLLLSFGTGLTVDIFMDTGGLHTAVCLFIAVVRNSVLTALLPQRLSDYPNLSPGVRNMGWIPFLTYAAVLILVHHICYYLIEIWSFRSFGYLLLKTFISFITSMVLVILYTLLFSQFSGGSNTLTE
ncbi:MAG: hypothetical protein BGO09_05800 [Bacteroidetes bacterium 47-18]|nr:MAG: hypothetical protein BGO09_05800 [Bacteroidetes bacterium 47-18]